MTETKPSKQQFIKGWTQGIFKVQIIAGLSDGDRRDTGTMVPAVHNIGLHAGDHASLALTGHGYYMQEVTLNQLVPELASGQSGLVPIGTLDQFADGTLVYTTERRPLVEAQKPASASDPATQALTKPAREFVVQVFTGQSFEEVVEKLGAKAPSELAA